MGSHSPGNHGRYHSIRYLLCRCTKKRLTKRSYYRKIPQTRQFVYECDSVFNRLLLATISLYLTQEPPKLWVCGLHGYRG